MMALETPDEIAISVRNIGKRYHRYANMRERLMHQFFPHSMPGGEEIWALQDISFDIRRGESVAIIGRNGGGKSTLLQILTGTLTPTTGQVEVNGRVCALLELGSGFNPEYSGRDNVMMNGLLLGLSRQQILDRFDEIADFAEIGDAIERPVKTYSSGMMLRLAFAVQVLADPDILIVDEALSVGDFFFQQKCFRYIHSLKEKGVTLLFVSHDLASVRDLCEKGLVLRSGRIAFFGDNLTAVNVYLGADAVNAQTIQATHAGKPSVSVDEPALWSCQSKGRDALHKVRLLNARGEDTKSFKIGESCRIIAQFNALSHDVHITITIKSKSNQILSSFGTHNLGIKIQPSDKDREICFDIGLPVEAGPYSIKVALSKLTSITVGEVLDETPWLSPFHVTWDYAEQIPPFYGMFGLPVHTAEIVD